MYAVYSIQDDLHTIIIWMNINFLSNSLLGTIYLYSSSQYSL